MRAVRQDLLRYVVREGRGRGRARAVARDGVCEGGGEGSGSINTAPTPHRLTAPPPNYPTTPTPQRAATPPPSPLPHTTSRFLLAVLATVPDTSVISSLIDGGIMAGLSAMCATLTDAQAKEESMIALCNVSQPD